MLAHLGRKLGSRRGKVLAGIQVTHFARHLPARQRASRERASAVELRPVRGDRLRAVEAGVDKANDGGVACKRPSPDLKAHADVDVGRHFWLRRRVLGLVCSQAVWWVDLALPRRRILRSHSSSSSSSVIVITQGWDGHVRPRSDELAVPREVPQLIEERAAGTARLRADRCLLVAAVEEEPGGFGPPDELETALLRHLPLLLLLVLLVRQRLDLARGFVRPA